MKKYRGVDVRIYRCLTAAPVEVNDLLNVPVVFTNPPPPGTNWIGGLVGPRVGLDYMEK
jgi:hypothetical protein